MPFEFGNEGFSYFKPKGNKAKSATQPKNQKAVVGFRSAGNGADYGRIFAEARKREDLKAQHGPVKVLWKDGKPVSTEPLSGD